MVAQEQRISQLKEQISLAIPVFKSLRKSFYGCFTDKDVQHSETDTFFNFFEKQLNSVKVIQNIEENSREAFIILRSVFESFFLFWLMLEGEYYIETNRYDIVPKKSKTPEEAAESTYQKWLKEKRQGKYPTVTNINHNPGASFITVTHRERGLFEKKDVKKTGKLIPRFYFAFHQYNPLSSFVSPLKIIKEGSLVPEADKKHSEYAKWLYHHFIRFESFIKKQLLNANELITSEEYDRILVHYNFLSAFTHPTRLGMITYANTDLVSKELVYLYGIRILILYSKKFLEYLKREKKQFDTSIFNKTINNLEKVSNYFWFIFNKPTKWDIEFSNHQKKWQMARERKPTKNVYYYKNPIEHLKKLNPFIEKD